MSFLSKRTFIIIGIFLILLAVGSIGALRLFSQRFQPNSSIPEGNSPFGVGSIENLVTYSDAGFIPSVISIAIDRGLGCAVRLVNSTAKPLKLGLSPHREERDPGPDYPEITPGDNFLFDPRFSGFTELRFHDHGTPAKEFTVKFEESCQ